MDEVREHNSLYHLFYFRLFSLLNKVKLVFSVCFLNYPCNKKYPENKSSPNAPKMKYNFFWNIWEHLALRTLQGEQPPGHEGPGAAPCLVGPWWPPPLILAPTHSILFPKKDHQPAQARVLAHFGTIFDLLAQSSTHKTTLGDCSSVCDSSNGPISFCSSVLFIANFCCWGDPVLELACQIYLVPSSSNAWYSL